MLVDKTPFNRYNRNRCNIVIKSNYDVGDVTVLCLMDSYGLIICDIRFPNYGVAARCRVSDEVC